MDVGDISKVWQNGGNFASGVFFGCVVSYVAQKLASSERIERTKIDLEREKQLLSQLEQKEKRIDELHVRLATPNKK